MEKGFSGGEWIFVVQSEMSIDFQERKGEDEILVVLEQKKGKIKSPLTPNKRKK
jgi:hypothetical protein